MAASNAGSGKANNRAKDQARAAMMKHEKNRGRFKDSVTRGFTGHGLNPGVRAMLRQMVAGRSVE